MKPLRKLSYHASSSPRQVLSDLAAWTPDNTAFDRYGEGDLIANFEAEVAELLGKAAAVFMPSGTMAQQIALRIWCDRQGAKNVAFHPTCHLEMHEAKAYLHVHGMQATLLGERHRLFTMDDLLLLESPEVLSALLIELPQREIGGQLPTWEALQEIIAWANDHEIHLHMDGARLWECRTYYQRSYADIALAFDSVYVSLYKALDGIAGAILAGDEDFVEEARLWRRRHGGTLVHMYPMVLSAKRGLEHYLEQMPTYVEKARAVCAALSSFQRLHITPNPPPTNMTHIHIDGDQEVLMEAQQQVKDELGIELFWHLRESWHDAASVYFEFVALDSTLALSEADIVTAFERLFEIA